jgi:hypothetical protein
LPALKLNGEELGSTQTFSSSLKTLQLLEAASGKGGSTVATALHGSVFKSRILSRGARSYLVRPLAFGASALRHFGVSASNPSCADGERTCSQLNQTTNVKEDCRGVKECPSKQKKKGSTDYACSRASFRTKTSLASSTSRTSRR